MFDAGRASLHRSLRQPPVSSQRAKLAADPSVSGWPPKAMTARAYARKRGSGAGSSRFATAAKRVNVRRFIVDLGTLRRAGATAEQSLTSVVLPGHLHALMQVRRIKRKAASTRCSTKVETWCTLADQTIWCAGRRNTRRIRSKGNIDSNRFTVPTIRQQSEVWSRLNMTSTIQYSTRSGRSLHPIRICRHIFRRPRRS